MSLSFSMLLRNARAQAVISALDSGVEHAKFQFFTGTKPAVTGSITTETLLGTCVLSKPCAIVIDGVIVFDVIANDPVADATGVIGWGRGFDGDGNFAMDFNCGTNGSNAMMIFNNLNVIAGGVISILSGTLTEGNL
jgi:hypothetical protein